MQGSVGHQARRGLKWLAAARAASALLNLVATFITIRLLTPEHFGLAAVATMLVGFISIVNDAGLATSLVRTPDLDERIVDRTQGLILLMNGAAYLVLAALAPLAERFFASDGLASVVLVAGLQLLILGPIAAPSALLQRELKFPALATSTVIEGVIGGVATVCLALAGFGVWSLVVGPLAGSVARVVFVTTQVERMPRPRLSLEGMAGALKFGGTLSAAQVLWAAYSRADTIIVGRVLGTQALGVYNVAMQIATLPMEKVAGIMNTVGLSTFATIQRDRAAVTEKYLWVTRVAAGVAFPVFWGISCVASEIADVVLGPTWGATAVPLLLVSLAVPFRFLSSLTEPVLLAIGRADLIGKNVLTASLIMIPGFLIGSRYGLVGVSASWPICYVAYFSYRALIAMRALEMPIADYWRTLARPVAAAAIMYGAVSLVRLGLGDLALFGWVRLALLIGAGALTYGLATALFNRSLPADIRRLLG